MPGVFAKDVILEIIRRLGVNGGVGYAYEYAGDIIERMSMDERMTICNMSIEGGRARRLRQSGRDDLRLPARPAVRAAGRGVRRGGRVVASMASDAGAIVRRRGGDRRGGDPADA